MSGARMLAWRLHAYGAAPRLESARVPPLRAPTDLLVAVRATSVNPLDVAMIDGYGARVLNTLRRAEGTDVEFPLVLGRDFVGEVVRAGPAARLRPGQRVWGAVPPHRPGAHGHYALVDDGWAGRAPESLSEGAAGGALYAALSACSALRAAGLRPGAGAEAGAGGRARVLLLGLGGVGQAALQLLAYGGAHVVVGCSAALHPLAARLGAAQALDRNDENYERRLDDAGPYDAVLDCAGVGGAGAARGRGARFVTLSSPLLRETDARGLTAGTLAAAAHLLGHEAAARRAPAVASAPAPACSPRVRWAFFAPCPGDVDMLRRLADENKFSVEVEQVFPWWEGAAAYSRAAAGHARGKLLLDFRAVRPPAASGAGPP